MRPVVLLLLVTAWIYTPVLSAGQIYEDRLLSAPQGGFSLRPSRMLTHWTWAWQAGQSDRARHAVNLGLHLAAGTLVGVLASALGASTWVSAGVFLLHPMQSEAVGYLSSRADVLMTIALIGTVLALRVERWKFAVVCGLVAMACKESGVAIVGLACLPWGARARSAWWLVPVFAAVALGASPLASSLMRVDGAGWGWICQQAAGLWGQLVGLVAPWTLMLAPDPPPFSTLQTMALLSAGLGFAVWGWRRAPLVTGWIVAVLALRFVVPTPDAVLNSHQVYAAMVGVSLGIGRLAR